MELLREPPSLVLVRGEKSPGERTGHLLHPLSAGIAVPLFALFAFKMTAARLVLDSYGEVFSRPRRHRAAVGCDLDGDGLIDLVLTVAGEPPIILWNRLEPRSWIRLRLEADPERSPPRSPPEGIGARVEVDTVAGRQVRRVVRRARHFSSRDASVHFGLDREELVLSKRGWITLGNGRPMPT